VLVTSVDEYLRRTSYRFGIFVSLPFILSVINAWSGGLGFVLFLFGVPAALIVLAVFSVIWLIGGVKVAGLRPKRSEKVAAILFVPICLTALYFVSRPLLLAGTYVGTASRLAINRGRYDDIIDKVRAKPVAANYAEASGVTYSVDVGPPVRVAFNPDGILDNWSGIIFDPTDEVMLADGFDPKTGKFSAPDRITKLFGGDLVECWPLWGHYYRCSFT
jgi:hypothetical protein